MRIFVTCLILFTLPMITTPQIAVNLKIEGIDKYGGKIYVSVFNSESTYKARNVFTSFVLNVKYETVTKELCLIQKAFAY